MYMIYAKKEMQCFGDDNMIFAVYDYEPTLKDVAIFIQKANKDKIFGIDCQLRDVVIRKIENGDITNFWETRSYKNNTKK